MENVTKIYLVGFGDIALSKEFPVPITKSVADIADITKKNSSYSKTITIPGTKENNLLLSNIFDINQAEGTFNINRKVKCFIYTNDVVVLKGYFRLTNVRKVAPVSPTGEDEIQYDSLVFDQTTNFYDKLGDSLMEDLDMSEFNHVYNYENVIGSSGNTWENGFVYPMMYNTNSTTYQTQDFWPAIYDRQYLKKMGEAHQYVFDSTFLNSDPFTKLILPYNGDRPSNSLGIIGLRKFRAQFTTGSSYSIQLGSLFSTGLVTPDLPYNDESTFPNFDSGGTYNNSSYNYVSPANQTADFYSKIPVRIKIWSPSGATFTNSGYGIPNISLNASLKFFKNGIVYPTVSSTVSSVLNTTTVPTLNPGWNYINPTGVSYITASANMSLNFAETVSVRVSSFILNTSSSGYFSGTTSVPVQVYAEIISSGDSFVNNYFLVDPGVSTPSEGDTIFMNEYIPKKIKQKDVFKSWVQEFNLFIEEDEENENKLIIKTRQEYYNQNTFVDWTNKFASDRDFGFQFLPELQNRDFILTHKKGTDDLSKFYFETYNETYGQKKFIFDNDFISGEKKVELAFASTPLRENGIIQAGHGMIVPNINSLAPKTELRQLYWGGWITGNTWIFSYRTTGGTATATTFSSYPYAGHFNRPEYPTLDLNFGECNQLYYSTFGNVTDNTLSNNYYYDYIQAIIDGKLFTGYFDLNEIDIQNVRFNDKVFIGGASPSYYYINKIIDFDANNPGLTKVELIKIDEGLQFTTSNKYNPTVGYSTGTLNTGVVLNAGEVVSRLPPVGLTLNTTNTTNAVTSIFAGVKGEGNIIAGGTKAYVIGDDNSVGGDNKSLIIGGSGNTIVGGLSSNLIIGNNNLVNYPSSTIIGSNSTADTSNILIVGDRISGSTPNTIYAQNVKVMSGGTFSSPSFAIGVTVGGGNNTAGSVALVNGLATVATKRVTNSIGIFLAPQNSGTTGSGAVSISTRVAGASFTIASTNATDDSTVAWWMIEASPM